MTITQIIALIVVVVISALFLAWKIYKQGLRDVAISLILQAEKTLNSGDEKLNMVIKGLISKLPFPFNLIPESVIKDFAQSTFDSIKEVLDYRGEGEV